MTPDTAQRVRALADLIGCVPVGDRVFAKQGSVTIEAATALRNYAALLEQVPVAWLVYDDTAPFLGDDLQTVIEVLEGSSGWPIAAIKIRGVVVQRDALRVRVAELEQALADAPVVEIMKYGEPFVKLDKEWYGKRVRLVIETNAEKTK